MDSPIAEEKCILKLDVPRNGPFPKFQRPIVLGSFSLDRERVYCSDLSQLKYIKAPKNPKNVKFDLNDKLSDTIEKNEEINEKLDNVLKWISHNVKPPIDERIGDIVCYRGLITTILCTPYENQEGWIINATKWNGVVYMCASDTEEKKQRKKQATPHDKRFFHWGYKFEQYMTAASPDAEPDLSVAQNQNEEFCVMFKSKLNLHRLMYGAEMDGVESSDVVKNLEDLQAAEFIELKTNRKIQHPKQAENFKKYKLIKWWCQSFLVGITKIWCGYRDDHGVIHQVEKMQVSDFPRKAKGIWDPALCMNFCDHFLTFVRDVVKEEEPHTVWQFQWSPGEDIVGTKIPGPSEFSFVHNWFADNAKKHK
ncbi:hypothetical protein R5R35_011747 [Gryllus longicercus]|uniref:Decapping nuclease n=1 Tax=Gryllus longicercus TaxID=2509291 RepID=A0AAN9YYD3_9ORTH